MMMRIGLELSKLGGDGDIGQFSIRQQVECFRKQIATTTINTTISR